MTKQYSINTCQCHVSAKKLGGTLDSLTSAPLAPDCAAARPAGNCSEIGFTTCAKQPLHAGNLATRPVHEPRAERGGQTIVLQSADMRHIQDN